MLTELGGDTISVSVLVLWHHLFLRASCVILHAIHGDGGATPYVRGPNWVRDRCCRVLCQVGFDVNDESYRLVIRLPYDASWGPFPARNGFNLLLVNVTWLSTRRVQFRSFHEVRWDSGQEGRGGRFLRASCVILHAIHGDGGATPYVQGPNWVRDRCCRVLCQVGFDVNDESYRLVIRLPYDASWGPFPARNGFNLLLVNVT